MNQTKIRKLAHKAAGGWLSLDAEGEWRLSEKEVEKFAELIVRECAKVAINCNAGYGDLRQGIAYSVKQHFGVEE
jgi:hypothetical protein